MRTGFIPAFTSAIINKKEDIDDDGNDDDNRKEAAEAVEIEVAIALVLTKMQKEQ
eukprot:CAMPEP_0170863256 /NCGR_PEP_ID=MMETSP0734-20130129/19589_1 /TAXON_ID=186038 /ORGANISM="Fragilariopsis kerguelensis, Strain L26-C5" /LENGTH=54 /DNA_ID=CAMNT_0011238269 /DNA_START=61 /DNA_END=228 /DNA_ORIENTATION=+